MSHCNYALITTSVLFVSVGVHAILKGLWCYGAAWLILSMTSILVHGLGIGRCADKIMVYTVVAIGAYYYYIGQRTILPPLLFILCVLLYFVYKHISHVWVHICAIIGHHVIIYYVPTHII